MCNKRAEIPLSYGAPEHVCTVCVHLQPIASVRVYICSLSLVCFAACPY